MKTNDATPVEVRRLFHAARETVFEAWTRPELIRQWNARPGVSAPVAEVDLRVGGKYRLHLRGPDGTVHRIVGVYRVVDRPDRLVYSWTEESDNTPSESLVTVWFRSQGDCTEVTVRHEQLAIPESVRRHAAGWQACLSQLEELLAQGSPNDDSGYGSEHRP